MEKFKVLESERLILRDFKLDDLPNFYNYRKEPDVAKYQTWDNYTMSLAAQFYKEQSELTFHQRGTWYQIAIALKETNELIGDCAIHFKEDYEIELGYTFSPLYQGKGYAFEAIQRIIDYLFTDLYKREITCHTDTRNERSIKLLKRLGFYMDDHLLCTFYNKGEYADEYKFVLTKDMWIRNRKTMNE